eukprot:Lankesteria_metandrocarpae@DN3432_c0_g1_i1.p1
MITESPCDTSSLCESSTTAGNDSPVSSNSFDTTAGDSRTDDGNQIAEVPSNCKSVSSPHATYGTCTETSTQTPDMQVCKAIQDDRRNMPDAAGNIIEYVGGPAVRGYGTTSIEREYDWDDVKIVKHVRQRYKKRRRIEGSLVGHGQHTDNVQHANDGQHTVNATCSGNNFIDSNMLSGNRSEKCSTIIEESSCLGKNGLHFTVNDSSRPSSHQIRPDSFTQKNSSLPVCHPEATLRGVLLRDLDILRCASGKFLKRVFVEADVDDIARVGVTAMLAGVGERRCLKTSEYGCSYLHNNTQKDGFGMSASVNQSASTIYAQPTTILKRTAIDRCNDAVEKCDYESNKDDDQFRFVYSPCFEPASVTDADSAFTGVCNNLANGVVNNSGICLPSALLMKPSIFSDDTRSVAEVAPQLSPRTIRRRVRDALMKKRRESHLNDGLHKTIRGTHAATKITPLGSSPAVQRSPFMSPLQTCVSLANWNVVDPCNVSPSAGGGCKPILLPYRNQFDQVFKIYSKSDLSGRAGNSPRTHGCCAVKVKDGDDTCASTCVGTDKRDVFNVATSSETEIGEIRFQGALCELSLSTFSWSSSGLEAYSSSADNCKKSVQVNGKHLLACRLIGGLRAAWCDSIISLEDCKSRSKRESSVSNAGINQFRGEGMDFSEELWQLSDLIARFKKPEGSDSLCCFLNEKWISGAADSCTPQNGKNGDDRVTLLRNALMWGSALVDFVPQTQTESRWCYQRHKHCFLRVLFVDNRTLTFLKSMDLRAGILYHWAIYVFATAFKFLLRRVDSDQLKTVGDGNVICLDDDEEDSVDTSTSLHISSADSQFMPNSVFHSVLCCMFPFDKCWRSNGEVSGYSLSLLNFMIATENVRR